MESSFVRLPPSLEDALRPVVDKEQEDRGPVTGLDDLFRVKGLDKCCSGLSIEELQLEMDGFITIEKYKTRVQNSIDYSSREEDLSLIHISPRVLALGDVPEAVGQLQLRVGVGLSLIHI